MRGTAEPTGGSSAVLTVPNLISAARIALIPVFVALIVDPDTTWIDADVTIGRDVTILPGTQLLGATTVGADAVVGPDTTLADTEVGPRAEVKRTEASLAVIGADAWVIGSVVMAGAVVEAGARLEHTALAPGARVARGQVVSGTDC